MCDTVIRLESPDSCMYDIILIIQICVQVDYQLFVYQLLLIIHIVTSAARSKTVSRRERHARGTLQTHTTPLQSRSRASPHIAPLQSRYVLPSTARKTTETTKLFKKNEKLSIQKLSKQYNIRISRIQQTKQTQSLRSVIPYDTNGTESDGALI